MAQAVVAALEAGVTRLVAAGVTGRIVIANTASFKGLPVSAHAHRPRMIATVGATANCDPIVYFPHISVLTPARIMPRILLEMACSLPLYAQHGFKLLGQPEPYLLLFAPLLMAPLTLQSLAASGIGDALDIASQAVGATIEPLINANPQLQLLDLYSLLAVSRLSVSLHHVSEKFDLNYFAQETHATNWAACCGVVVGRSWRGGPFPLTFSAMAYGMWCL